MEVNSGGDKNSPRPDPMYYYETPGGSKLSLWPSGTLKIEVNGSAHVRSCMEWHALAVASFARPSQQQTKPDLWWNGFRRYDERTGTYPSVSESEDTNHDIPLYSGWNAAAQSAPSPLATQTYFKGGGELGWCIHCGTPASKHELGGACIAEICAPSTPATPKGCTPLKDYIAEQERIPERKAALDEARAALASSPSSIERSEEQTLLEAALCVMEQWDEGLDKQDGREYENACKDWADCLASLRAWKKLSASPSVAVSAIEPTTNAAPQVADSARIGDSLESAAPYLGPSDSTPAAAAPTRPLCDCPMIADGQGVRPMRCKGASTPGCQRRGALNV
jgi:hypothetical protein